MTIANPYGIGLRRQHYTHLLAKGPSRLGFFEIISEDLFNPGGRPWAVARRVRKDLPIALHGVGLGIGNVEKLSESYLERLSEIISALEPAIVSDHLCWGSVDGLYAHELLPMPYDDESLLHLVSRIDEVQERIGRRLLLENPSTYAAFRQNTWAEAEFLNELCRRTGCGVLLDVNNVVVSSVNVGLDAVSYIDALDPGAVGQIHLAGHTHRADHILDTHVGPVPEATWDVYRRAVRRFGEVPSLVEWDTDVPDYDTVVGEAVRAREIAARVLEGTREPTLVDGGCHARVA